MATVSIRVNESTGDATERSDDTNFSTNSDGGNNNLYSGRSGAGGNPFWQSGQRFTNVTIPNGSTINSATITITASANGSVTSQNAKIFAQAADNPGNFTTDPDVTNRTPTTAGVVWTLPTSFTLDTAYSSPDISSVIQEIVNRAGWVSGNAIVLLNFPTAGTVGDGWTYYHYDTSSTKCALLDVDYTAPASANGNFLAFM